jgi:hypothetical protein
MRTFLTVCLLLLGLAVCLDARGYFDGAAGAALFVIAARQLYEAALVRRARRVVLPRSVVVDDIAPHLRALRDVARAGISRADVLVDRLSTAECHRLTRAGCLVDLSLRGYIDAHKEISTIVEVAEQQPEPRPPRAAIAPVPRIVRSSDFDEHTAITRTGAA